MSWNTLAFSVYFFLAFSPFGRSTRMLVYSSFWNTLLFPTWSFLKLLHCAVNLKFFLPGGTNPEFLLYGIGMNPFSLAPYYFSRTSSLQMASLQAPVQARAAESGLEVMRLTQFNWTTHLMCSEINVVNHQWFIIYLLQKTNRFSSESDTC